MTLQIATDATACGKCGGLLTQEQIGKEIDVVCRNCGDRRVAVARVLVGRAPVITVGMEDVPTSGKPAYSTLPSGHACSAGQPIPWPAPGRNFAPMSCNQAARKERYRLADMRVCPTCGEPFQTKHGNAVYCSDRCKPVSHKVRNYA